MDYLEYKVAELVSVTDKDGQRDGRGDDYRHIPGLLVIYHGNSEDRCYLDFVPDEVGMLRHLRPSGGLYDITGDHLQFYSRGHIYTFFLDERMIPEKRLTEMSLQALF